MAGGHGLTVTGAHTLATSTLPPTPRLPSSYKPPGFPMDVLGWAGPEYNQTRLHVGEYNSPTIYIQKQDATPYFTLYAVDTASNPYSRVFTFELAIPPTDTLGWVTADQQENLYFSTPETLSSIEGKDTLPGEWREHRWCHELHKRGKGAPR